MALAETLGRWLGRVEIAIAGLDARLREGEEALARGEGMRARSAAHAILGRIPGSPLGLALLADACEAAGLDAEAHLALEDLSTRAGSRSEVWLRLGNARARTGADAEEVRDAFVRALAVAAPGSDERRAALLALSDLDLARGDAARAELWLERIVIDPTGEAAARKAEARLLLGDAKGALRVLEGKADDPTDGRTALLRGRALAMTSDPAAYASILRAYMLDVPGASELLSSTVAWIPTTDEVRGRVKAVVEAQGEADTARFRAAFARASGDRVAARAALFDAVKSGDRTAARALFDASLEDRVDEGLAAALAALEGSTDRDVRDARKLPSATVGRDEVPAALDALRTIASERVLGYADGKRRDLLRTWVPPTGAAVWPAILARLDAHARELHDLEATAEVAELSRERKRPVRVAIVGEFNAGKSTFINALVGADVAPTGVLPTTATLHHLRYGPDPIARILLEGEGPRERLVPPAELRATLKSIDPELIRRVEILVPIASLTRVEILDTPGFNAPDARHTRAARDAFEEADAAIWLLDAAQPLKASERGFLEEAKALGLPVQILVNKTDRLGAEDLAKVMTMVEEALASTGLDSYRPPLPLSARLALQGKLGDAEALAASRWADVQKLLDEEIVARSDELKERALRRRAARIVARLATNATAAATSEEERLAAARERRRLLRAAAARLDESADVGARAISERIAKPLEAWRGDLELLVTGRDAGAAAQDPAMQRYRVDRAVARIASPLAEALVALTQDAGIEQDAWLSLARTIVRAAAWTGGAIEAAALARAALGSAVDELAARAVVPVEAALFSGLRRELEALAAVLAGLSPLAQPAEVVQV